MLCWLKVGTSSQVLLAETGLLNFSAKQLIKASVKWNSLPQMECNTFKLYVLTFI